MHNCIPIVQESDTTVDDSSNVADTIFFYNELFYEL